MSAQGELELVVAGTLSHQRHATDPHASAWVSANAGSGKTYVLVRRVVRLLLDGVDPARILCLTFTRAAAAEMSGRVFAMLSDWTLLDDEALAAAIAEIEGNRPPPERLAGARRLFARALDTPGGLKIQTIHAFCERLLHQFPFEANVAGGFRVVEDIEAKALIEEARRRVWAKAAGDRAGLLGRALERVLKGTSDFVHETSLAEFIEKRDLMRRWHDSDGPLDHVLPSLREALGLSEGETGESLRLRVIGDSAFDQNGLRQLLGLLEQGGKRDKAAATRLRPAVEGDNDLARAEDYLGYFAKSNGDGFLTRDYLATKKTRASWPGLDDMLEAELHRIEALHDRILAADCFESSSALLRLADAAIAEYESLKRRRGLLDFEDLVVKTVTLLSRSDASAWVHYKLDRGLQHILVDEAQDTSPRQWQVVRALAGEFFAGEGAVTDDRTIFAVGDEKQSIYSFQGAVPAWFGRVRREMRGQARASGLGWNDVPLRTSFRSTSAVLSAVDRVFAREGVYEGVTFEEGAPVHEPNRRDEPGRVVVWPLFEPPEQDDPTDWAQPMDHLGKQSAEMQLATRIATTIRTWLDQGERFEATGEPIRAGDILILTRARGALNDAVNRELKKRGVPVAGADRLALVEHIAVMDLLALGRFTQMPRDDLNLAALLKSPLIGLDDAALERLAKDRKGSLWGALAQTGDGDDRLGAVRDRLRAWRARAAAVSPYAFFAEVLAADGGRSAFLGRLGPEVGDVLDEFLGLALQFERAEIPAMQGFVAWLDDPDRQVKRDADAERDEVRVMTVHGAKGLEAGVVFLLDNCSLPVHGNHHPRALPLSEDPDSQQPAGLIWNRGRKNLPAVAKTALDAWEKRAREEYRRLLYVGMTRARDRLYVCGAAKKTAPKDDGWYNLVRGALEPDSERVTNDDGAEDLIWGGVTPFAAATPVTAVAEREAEQGPPWLSRPAPAAPAGATRVRPSGAAGCVSPATFASSTGDGGTPGVSALERGDVIHRLLQSLPDREPGERRQIAERYLDRAAAHWPEEERGKALEEVMTVLEHPEFADVFKPTGRSEVAVAANRDGNLIAGRIDRLAVEDQRILIVDYKTNRVVPASIGEAPMAYLNQLAHYRAILQRIYPGRRVETALLWTSGPVLMPVPEDVMTGAEPPANA